MDDGIEVTLAETDEEREALQRFRYDVYVEELGRYRARADHGGRRLADPEDERSWNVVASAGGAIVASTRLTWGGSGFSDRQVEQYQLAPFLKELPAERLLVGERTMIHPHWRGAGLFERLGELCTTLTEDHDVAVVFGACEPHLISFYARYQRPYGSRNINSPEAGFLVPLLSFPAGVDALLPFGRDGRLPRCIEQAQTETGTVLSPLLSGEDTYADALRQALGGLQHSVFEGMTWDEVAPCVHRSNIVTCAVGDRLLKAGGSARNAFVVLDGALSVSRGGVPVGSIGPGEIVGEMAALLQQPRGSDVDVVADGTRLLSLSERTLATLAEEAPVAAAKLSAAISRHLCRRLAAAGAA
jgi:hypothetical protein